MCMYVCGIYIYMYVCMHTYIRVCLYTHTHTSHIYRNTCRDIYMTFQKEKEIVEKKPIVTPTYIKKKNRCSDSLYCIVSSLLKFLYHRK